MKQSEVKELSAEALQAKLVETKKQYADMKLAHAVTPLENPLELRKVRKSVARLATELTKRDHQ
ncbi:MAG TPA: 50S ribosomal protein L29 [Flavobacteriaceae bacterium]|jgi:large subunit ribosomal protein L29|nr:50S ribosomal protein L29 [Flavobacteriaceae bacterium]MDP4674909.1 50S ribosomal protein L29 [Flavobacteriaceae bacterium]MDP4755417.1 50S ribosomal protein L29 [Flavobacteriaceae bacterium]MDP4794070.1 50S ribosomal protein L29 [Flavobacteriaceae bacterium]MDP4885328.1 50S ribosomal protein L29 [Flavobacteriaceae bacterium]